MYVSKVSRKCRRQRNEAGRKLVATKGKRYLELAFGESHHLQPITSSSPYAALVVSMLSLGSNSLRRCHKLPEDALGVDDWRNDIFPSKTQSQ